MAIRRLDCYVAMLVEFHRTIPGSVMDDGHLLFNMVSGHLVLLLSNSRVAEFGCYSTS